MLQNACKARQVWHRSFVVLQVKGWHLCVDSAAGPLLQHPLLQCGSAGCLQGSQLPLLRLLLESALRHN